MTAIYFRFMFQFKNFKREVGNLSVNVKHNIESNIGPQVTEVHYWSSEIFMTY